MCRVCAKVARINVKHPVNKVNEGRAVLIEIRISGNIARHFLQPLCRSGARVVFEKNQFLKGNVLEGDDRFLLFRMLHFPFALENYYDNQECSPAAPVGVPI